MALRQELVVPSSFRVVRDDVANATAEVNISGGTVPVTIYNISVDNSQNNTAVYLKIYDAVAVTVGTTAPNYVFMIPASTVQNIMVLSATASGFILSTGFSMACVTTGGTAGTGNPTNTVTVAVSATW